MQGSNFDFEGGEAPNQAPSSEPGPDMQVLFQEFRDQDRLTQEDSLSNSLRDILAIELVHNCPLDPTSARSADPFVCLFAVS